MNRSPKEVLLEGLCVAAVVIVAFVVLFAAGLR